MVQSPRIGLAVKGVVADEMAHRNTLYSGVVGIAGIAGVSLDLTPRLSLAVETTLPAEMMKRDGELAVVVMPAGWLGLVVRY